MDLILPFLFGFFFAIIGVLPPGLINITAAKVGLKDGKTEAISFAFGATIIVFFQSFLALMFANIINTPNVINLLQEIGFVLFSILTLYFLWKAKRTLKPKEKIKVRSKTNRFFYGLLLSSLNVFPIPYYLFVSITLSTSGYFKFLNSFIFSFLFGVVLGTFLIFNLYILFFKKRNLKSSFLMDNGNYIVAVITGLVSLITFFKMN